MTAVNCIWESRSPIALLRLTGRLDLSGGVQVREALHKALAEQPSAIVIDVSELAVDDPIALTLFIAFSHTAAHWSGCLVALCAPSPGLNAFLEQLVVGRGVPVYASKPLALTAVATASAARRYRQQLPATPDAVEMARQVVLDACRAWNLPELVSDAETVVTELVANAVRHGSGRLLLSVALGEKYVHLCVRDGSRVAPGPCLTGIGGTGRRRGLAVVESIAAAWGSIPTVDGKVVWATLRRPPVRQPETAGGVYPS